MSALGSFLPGVIVLLVGLIVGGGLAWRLRRTTPIKAKVAKEDLQLEVSDLAQRRDALYAQLESEDIDPAERDRLERSAANVLRKLDKIAPATVGSVTRTVATPPSTEAPNPYAGLIGFAFGAGLVGLFALLFLWAQRDATPAPPDAMPRVSEAPSESLDLEGVDPAIAERIGRIRAALDRNPQDIGTRKAYAEALLAAGKLYDAYTEADIILQAQPGDVDGLYFQGLVRLSMGQGDAALELLGKALKTAPDYVNARLVRGIAYLRMDRREDAINDWEIGLNASNGQHPGLEQLLQMAHAGMSAEEMLGVGPGGSSSEPRDQPVRTAEAASPGVIGAAPGGPSYRLRLRLAAGATPPPGAVLFVSLRDGTPGAPPAAVKRIDRPSFPIDVVLGSADSMLGRPLPESGMLSARLDADGSATTRDPSDLSVTVEATAGSELELTLATP